MTEHEIQNEIRAVLSPYAVMFRCNVGCGYTRDGSFFSTGLPQGFSDLFGVRSSDGKAIFIESNIHRGKKVRWQGIGGTEKIPESDEK